MAAVVLDVKAVSLTGSVSHSAVVPVKPSCLLAACFLRRLPPFSSRQWARCTTRSMMASPIVMSPVTPGRG